MNEPSSYVTRIYDTIVQRVQDSLLVSRVIEKWADEENGVWHSHIDAGLNGSISVRLERSRRAWLLYVYSNQIPKQYELQSIDDVDRMFANPQLLMI